MIHNQSVFFEILLQTVICYICDLINKKGEQLGFFQDREFSWNFSKVSEFFPLNDKYITNQYINL